MSSSSSTLFNALIKTHHMTSRKKIASIKKNAHRKLRYALIRTGGSPGLMYAEGAEEDVKNWIRGVQALRYKDFQLLCRAAPVARNTAEPYNEQNDDIFVEVESVQAFAAELEARGVRSWWQRAMGYSNG